MHDNTGLTFFQHNSPDAVFDEYKWLCLFFDLKDSTCDALEMQNHNHRIAASKLQCGISSNSCMKISNSLHNRMLVNLFVGSRVN